MCIVKRIIVVSVTLVLIASFMACNKTGDSSQTASGESGKFKDRVTLNVVAFVGKDEPDGRRTDPVSRYVEDTLNINLELTGVGDNDYQTLFSAMMASNDMPDVFVFPFDYSRALQALIDSNQLLAIDPYLEEYAPLTRADRDGRIMLEGVRGPAYSPDGKQYVWGMVRGSYDDGIMAIVSHYLLWDAYKKAGYPKLENYDDDLLDVLEKMMVAEPRSLSGEKTYGLGAWFGDGQGWGEWIHLTTPGWQEGAAISENSGLTLAISSVDSSPINVNQLTDPESFYWRCSRFFNRAYRRGILDPDSVIQKNDEYTAKANDGRYMYTIPNWIAAAANQEFNKTPGNEKTFISMPSLTGKAERRFDTMLIGERLYGISAKTKYPERCVALLDFLSTYEFSRIAVNGLDGVNWNMVNGKPVPNEEYLAAERNSEFSLKTGAGVYDHFMGYFRGTVDPATGVSIDLHQYSSQAVEKKTNKTIRDFLTYYGNDNWADLYRDRAEVTDSVILTSFGNLPENIIQYLNELNAYRGTNFVKVIVAKDEAEFVRLREEFIAGLKEHHAEEVFQYFYNDALKQQERISKLVAMRQ